MYVILENIYLLFAGFDENCNLHNVHFVKKYVGQSIKFVYKQDAAANLLVEETN